MPPEHKTIVYRIGHNADYLDSLRTGFVHGLWFLPTQLVEELIDPLRLLAISLIHIFATLGRVTYAQMYLFAQGILGRLRREVYDGRLDPSQIP